jgi:hypothetical protein
MISNSIIKDLNPDNVKGTGTIIFLVFTFSAWLLGGMVLGIFPAVFLIETGPKEQSRAVPA